MNRLTTAAILLFFIALANSKIVGQNLPPAGIRLVRITYLTSNLDSLTRTFIKKGFRIIPGKREPDGVFNNKLMLQDGSEIILETTLSSNGDDWRVQTLRKYKNYISGLVFEVDSIESLLYLMKLSNIPIQSININKSYAFALDSCAPLDVVFIPNDTLNIYSKGFDSFTRHPNHVFRFDWILLSASPLVELRLRKFFEVVGARKMHGGCCDFWRLGPPDDFCFFRFDPLPPKAKGIKDWLSIEPNGIYFAY